jgi:EAL domain-containing protein (putative c-di-GMP-specific phosphodiesterase class I)
VQNIKGNAKVDRAFVSKVDTDPKKRLLLRGIIELTHALGMVVVAEGAETAGELAQLRKLNADYVQGFVFSLPLPPMPLL